MSGFLLRQAADAEDEGGDVPGRFEDFPVRIYEVDGSPCAVGVWGERGPGEVLLPSEAESCGVAWEGTPSRRMAGA